MNAKLIAEEGDLKGTVLSLGEGDEWVIGRDPDLCQLILEDPTASRRHLACYKTSEGILVENLSTTNPIKVNDEEVETPRLLQHGDVIKIGEGLFRFYSDTDAHVLDNALSDVSADSQLVSQEMNEMRSPSPVDKEPQMRSFTDSSGDRGEQPDEEGELEHDSIFEEDGGDRAPLAEIDFGITEAGRWLLKVVSGPNNGAEFYMQSPQSYLIGTDPLTCDIVFHDTSVSRQHARITVNPDETLTIEDLNSRNGVFVNGERVVNQQMLQPSLVVTLGTTSLVVYDREGEMQTIISPLLPSIVKVLQEKELETTPSVNAEVFTPQTTEKAEDLSKEKSSESMPEGGEIGVKRESRVSYFIILSVVIALFVVVGVGVTTLFETEPVVAVQQESSMDQIKQALSPFPAVQYSFNKSAGRLLLLGHLKTSSEKNQLLYNLQGLSAIKFIDDSGIIIDEYVWGEINQILSKNPAWKGISIYSPAAGKFVLSGYLETRKQAEQLNDYLSLNFPYVDLLERKIVVAEDVTNQVNALIKQHDIKEIKVQFIDGDITLTGTVVADKKNDMEKVVEQVRDISGVHSVKNFTTFLASDSGVVNISDRYEVTGFSRLGTSGYTVIINGKILAVGAILDGMKITSIQPGMILLEEGGVRYRIDFNK